jgi:hypothetical protein
MFQLIGYAAFALAATISPHTAAPTQTIQPVVTAPVRAAAAPGRRDRRQMIAVGQSATTSDDDQELQRQIERRVLMPVLSGDGGG